MADPISTLTRNITRDKLARVFKTHEGIKMMEDLTRDVSGTLADAVNLNISDIEIATESAMLAMACAASARDSAAIAESMAREAQVLLQTIRTQAADISTLHRELSELRALLQTSRTQSPDISALRSQVDELRTITLGA